MIRLIPLISCDEKCYEKTSSVISNGLNNLSLLFSGLISVDTSLEGITPILETTSTGGTFQATAASLSSPEEMYQSFKKSEKPEILGVRISGTFKSAFP